MPLIQEPSSSPISTRDHSAQEKRTQRIQIKNRRKLYLDRHPSYFTSPDLELASPLLYDHCIRRFQNAAEREADGRSKGYSGILEADLYRAEAKIAALETQKQMNTRGVTSSLSSSSLFLLPQISSRAEGNGVSEVVEIPYVTRQTTASGAHGGSSQLPFEEDEKGEEGEGERECEEETEEMEKKEDEEDDKPQSKEEGLERWKFAMTVRFLSGSDEDFDYKAVDESEDWDEIEGREEEERWFDEEEPEWLDDEEEQDIGANKEGTGGETGIQDF